MSWTADIVPLATTMWPQKSARFFFHFLLFIPLLSLFLFCRPPESSKSFFFGRSTPIVKQDYTLRVSLRPSLFFLLELTDFGYPILPSFHYNNLLSWRIFSIGFPNEQWTELSWTTSLLCVYFDKSTTPRWMWPWVPLSVWFRKIFIYFPERGPRRFNIRI